MYRKLASRNSESSIGQMQEFSQMAIDQTAHLSDLIVGNVQHYCCGWLHFLIVGQHLANDTPLAQLGSCN